MKSIGLVEMTAARDLEGYLGCNENEKKDMEWILLYPSVF